MPEPEAVARKSLDDAVFDLGTALARLPPGPLAELRRAHPGKGAAAFWRVYHQQRLDAQPGHDADWEWVVTALARLTPTGNDPDRRSAHAAGTSLGRALFRAGVREPRVAKVLNAGLRQRRGALMRLVRMLARTGATFDTRELARLMLFADPDPARENPLRHLAREYYAAEAAAQRGESDA